MPIDSSQLDRYDAAGPALRAAVAGLTPDQLAATPVPGKWSVRTLVLHLADCEQVFADRMKRIIAEDNPSLLAFDETKWAAGLAYDQLSVADAVELIVLTRRQMARTLRSLPAAAFDRFGTHNQAGRLTLVDLLTKANNHWDNHLRHLADKLKALGKA